METVFKSDHERDFYRESAESQVQDFLDLAIQRMERRLEDLRIETTRFQKAHDEGKGDVALRALREVIRLTARTDDNVVDTGATASARYARAWDVADW